MDAKFVEKVNVIMAGLVGAQLLKKNTYEFKNGFIATPEHMGFNTDLNKLQEVVSIVAKWHGMQHLRVDFTQKEWMSLHYLEYGKAFRNHALVSTSSNVGNRYPTFLIALYMLVGEFLVWRFGEATTEEIKK